MNPNTKTTQAATHQAVEFRDLGRMRYGAALELQQRLHAQVLAGEAPPTVLLLEHEPVVTISKRDSARQNLVAAPALLERLGVEIHDTDRGGDITYHGPGQLVAYPMLPLESFGLNLRSYVRLLEEVVIQTIAGFGIAAHRDACAVGVWVGEESRSAECGSRIGAAPLTASDQQPTIRQRQSRKIAAIGVRVKRWVSMHGLALNVTTNLDHFKLIVPCGLAGRPVTSMKQELAAACPSMDAVKAQMMRAFERLLAPRRE